MSKRVVFAGLFHETHTFLDGVTALDHFHVRRGSEMLKCLGDSSPLGGALQAARDFGWATLPSIDFRAAPSAIVDDAVIEAFWKEFATFYELHREAGIDAIYLVLHGAMASKSLYDVEGEILERIRTIPGAALVPVFGVFDLHANFTQRMAQHANCLVAYRENPHTDAREAAVCAARLLQRCFETGQLPRMVWEHPPLMWPPTGTGTAGEPMKSLESLAREIEAASPEIWAMNVAAGFSFADTPDAGVSFSAVTAGDEAAARAQLKRLVDFALAHRAEGNVVDPPVETVFAQLRTRSSGLTVIVEPSDNIGGGAPGDGTGLLRALVEHGIENAAIAINDPHAVERLQGLPVGFEVALSMGGKGSRLDAGPLKLKVELISKGHGRFELEDKQSHLASMSGDTFDMGHCAVVQYEGITILLTSNKTPPFDLGQWRSQGLEPKDFSVIAVKAAVAHRRAYDPIAAHMFWVDTPGPCTSNLKALPYQNVRRPIYPLDEI
ncbi:MAG: M81 family metallopeptidase [Verrucomicrobiota bacterium]